MINKPVTITELQRYAQETVTILEEREIRNLNDLSTIVDQEEGENERRIFRFRTKKGEFLELKRRPASTEQEGPAYTISYARTIDEQEGRTETVLEAGLYPQTDKTLILTRCETTPRPEYERITNDNFVYSKKIEGTSMERLIDELRMLSSP